MLEAKLVLAQKNLSKKDPEILSLNSELAKLKTERIAIESKEIKTHQSRFKILENKLALVQKDLTKKDSEILSLKAKLDDLQIENNDLKPEIISQNLSNQVKLPFKKNS